MAFYKKLGFLVFKRVERKQDVVVLLYGHGINIEMFVDAGHPRPSIPEPLGLRHLALQVDDIVMTSKNLNLEIGPIMKDWLGEKFCFAVDPDGNKIELHE